ncbi:MAG: hypothetical protein KGP12_08350 [Actinomycetales bacterium]|nr:hypothetical protein [Actinomycetales bacterium]
MSAGPAAAEAIVCEGVPRAGVALDPAAKACADNGFEPAADEFNFPNWGGKGSLSASGMIAMFGPDAVCAQRGEGTCTLFPAAQDWLDQVNEAMAGGRCEGMAVLSAKLEDGGAPVEQLQAGAVATVELAQQTESVVHQIEYWWATQMVSEVAGPTSQIRALQPSEVVATLVQGLADGKGYTLGMYAQGAGHAVTPFAVSLANGVYDIAIYDNNYPNSVSHLMVDPVAQTWTYDEAAVNPDAQAAAWTGTGPGTLDLTAMDWRAGPFVAPFVDDAATSKGQGPRTFLVTAAMPPGAGTVGARITIGGSTVDTTADLSGAAAALPAGAVVTLVKAAGTVVGVQVLVPAGAGAVSVEPVIQRSPSAAGGRTVVARVSVDGPGQPRVTIRGAVSQGGGAFSLRSDAKGNVSVASVGTGKVTVEVSNGRRSVSIPVPDGGQVDVSVDDAGNANVTITDEDGEEYEYVLEADSEDGEVIEVFADITDGELVVDEEVVEPEAVDEAFVRDLEAAATDDQSSGGDAADSVDEADSGGSDAGGGSDSSGSDAGGGSDSSGSDAGGGSDSSGSDAGGGSDSGGSDAGGSDGGGSDSGGSDAGGSDGGGSDSGGSDAGGDG